MPCRSHLILHRICQCLNICDMSICDSLRKLSCTNAKLFVIAENRSSWGFQQARRDSDALLGGVIPPNIFRITIKLFTSPPCWNRNGHCISCDLFFIVTVVGQMVKMPQWKVLRHISGETLSKINDKHIL